MFILFVQKLSKFPMDWGLRGSARCQKAVFGLHAEGSWNSSVLETPEIPGNLG